MNDSDPIQQHTLRLVRRSVWRRFSAGAAARDIPQAAYLEALLKLHDAMLERESARAELTRFGIGPVRA